MHDNVTVWLAGVDHSALAPVNLNQFSQQLNKTTTLTTIQTLRYLNLHDAFRLISATHTLVSLIDYRVIFAGIPALHEIESCNLFTCCK